MPKLKKSNTTFWVIFKHSDNIENQIHFFIATLRNRAWILVLKKEIRKLTSFHRFAFGMKKEWLIKNYKILELHVREQRTSHEGRRQRDELHFKYRSQS